MEYLSYKAKIARLLLYVVAKLWYHHYEEELDMIIVRIPKHLRTRPSVILEAFYIQREYRDKYRWANYELRRIKKNI